MHSITLRAALIFASTALFVAVPRTTHADDDVEPPQLRWSRCPSLLTVKVFPTGASHLSPDLPVEVVVDDGDYFVVRWTERDLPKDGPVRIRVPRVASKASGGWTLKVSGGVCNDDESICLPFHASVELPRHGPARGRTTAERGRAPGGDPPRTPAPPAAPDDRPVVDPDSDPAVTDAGMLHPGTRWFHTHDSETEAAFAEAMSSGRNVLVDFYATWCPPCDRLRDEFLRDPARLSLLSGFVLLKADADDPTSFALKDRYKVGGYPTLLVVGGDGSELDRVLGFDSDSDRLAARLEPFRGGKGTLLAEDAPLAERLRRALAADDQEAAWAALSELDPPAHEQWDDYDSLRLALDAADGHPEAAAPIAAAAAAAAPTAGAATYLVYVAAEALRELGKEAEADELIAGFRAEVAAVAGSRSPAGVVLGRGHTSIVGQLVRHEPELHDDLAQSTWYRADWTDDPVEAQALLAEGAVRLAAAMLLDEPAFAPELPEGPDGRISVVVPEQLLAEGMAGRLANQEGRVHDLVSILKRAELVEVADPIYRQMISLHPDDFTWHYAYAGFLRDLRGGVGAVDAARTAHAVSYGDNRLRAARRLAELLRDADDVTGAEAVVRDALAAPPPDFENVRTHRYRTALTELLAELSSTEPQPPEPR